MQSSAMCVAYLAAITVTRRLSYPKKSPVSCLLARRQKKTHIVYFFFPTLLPCTLKVHFSAWALAEMAFRASRICYMNGGLLGMPRTGTIS